MSESFGYEDFKKYTWVSRETYDRLVTYGTLIKKWQKSINLISPTTVSNLFLRHIIDSAQLSNFLNPEESLLDMGSGAGFPGMVLAIMGHSSVTLVESDKRKAIFLQEVARITKSQVTIVMERVEVLDIDKVSVITARGFASITGCLDLLEKKLKSTHKILLLKGKEHKKELTKASQGWMFDYKLFPSKTDSQGVILELKHLMRKGNL